MERLQRERFRKARSASMTRRNAWVRSNQHPVGKRSNHLLGFALTFALVFLLGGPLSSPAAAFDDNAPAHLQCEGMQEPLGIDIVHPRLSWQLQDSRRGARQARV